MLEGCLPSVSVALSRILSKVWRHEVDAVVAGSAVLPGKWRPVPNDTTHCSGASGHNCFASCIASAVGLFTKIPPSCKQHIYYYSSCIIFVYMNRFKSSLCSEMMLTSAAKGWQAFVLKVKERTLDLAFPCQCIHFNFCIRNNFHSRHTVKPTR